MHQEYKTCPECTRVAQIEALTCQRCGHWFGPELKETEAEKALRETAAQLRRQEMKRKLMVAYLGLTRMRTGSIILFVDCLLLHAPTLVSVIAFFLMVGVWIHGIKLRETAGDRGVSLREVESSTRERSGREAMAATLVTVVLTMIVLILKATPHH